MTEPSEPVAEAPSPEPTVEGPAAPEQLQAEPAVVQTPQEEIPPPAPPTAEPPEPPSIYAAIVEMFYGTLAPLGQQETLRILHTDDPDLRRALVRQSSWRSRGGQQLELTVYDEKTADHLPPQHGILGMPAPRYAERAMAMREHLLPGGIMALVVRPSLFQGSRRHDKLWSEPRNCPMAIHFLPGWDERSPTEHMVLAIWSHPEIRAWAQRIGWLRLTGSST